jgi:hypothetical protein
MPDPSDKRPLMIIAVIGLLIAGVVVLSLVRLPLPLRLAVAGVDLIAALVLFALSRQQNSR